MTVVGFITGVVALAALGYDYRPQVFVAPGAALDETNPMSMQFNVTNSGKLSLSHIGLACTLNDVIMTKSTRVTGGGTINAGGGFAARVLLPSESTPFECPFDKIFRFADNQTLVNADIAVQAVFELAAFPRWKSRRDFRFVTQKRKDGQLIWFAAPVRQ